MSEDSSGGKKRRDVLKALPVATVGVSMASGVGAALPDTSETSDERMTREEKAREAGYDWDEDWIDEDMIGKDSVGRFTKHGGTNCVGGDVAPGGVKFTLEVCFKEGEATTELEVFDQNFTQKIDSSEYCGGYDVNAGAAYLDIQFCVNWDDRCVDVTGEGCVWEFSSWNCGTTDYTSCL